MGKRRKHVLDDIQVFRSPTESERILRVISLRGGNIVEAERPDGTTTLVRIPQKFNKLLWVKRGSFLFAQMGEYEEKVSGEVTQVLYADHVRQLRKEPGIWPPEFDAKEVESASCPSAAEVESGEPDDSDDDGEPLEANSNHRAVVYDDDSDEEEED
ncbi:hypothetical protein CYMTET_9122 [Cymbomonas tetramitiformis]|uniref:S1-like domain-containing protein n=1 Tax=Cymbomonas tetramitiformis TaxID=36881 RepID=A0AAE0GS30_9CHLO|nr:hypothetical protein CYMTET_9122 [Cymbomonas tetramitiformis]